MQTIFAASFVADGKTAAQVGVERANFTTKGSIYGTNL